MRDAKTLTTDKVIKGLYVLLFIIIVYVHFQQQTGIYDDAWFYERVQDNGLLPFVLSRYGDWTSRLIIEFTMCALLLLPKAVWIVMDSFMFLLIIHCIRKLCQDRAKKYPILKFLCIPLCMVLIPFASLYEAGWYATTMNYIWPMALGLYVLVRMDHFFRGNTPGIQDKTALPIALLYAANQEQMLAVLFGFMLVFIGLFKYEKRKVPMLFFGILLFILGMLVFHLTCPGNASRAVQEAAASYREYAGFSGLDKLALGICVGIRFYFLHNKITLLFLAALTVLTVLKRKQILDVLLSIFITSLTWVLSMGLVRSEIPVIRDLAEAITLWEKAVPYVVVHDSKTIITVLFGGFMLISIGYLLFSSADKDAFPIGIMILAALGTKMMMGFSATVYASGSRTMIFAGYITIVAILILLGKSIDKTGDFILTKMMKEEV